MRIAQEEIFGPVVAVMPIDSFEQAMEIANGVRYGLSASIYTRDVNKALSRPCATCTRALSTSTRPPSARRFICPSAAPSRPATAIAKPATAALDFYSEWKTLYIDYSDRLQRAQMDG